MDEAAKALSDSISEHSFDSNLNFVHMELERLKITKKKRRRIKPEEIAILKEEFLKNPEWDPKKIKELAQRFSWSKSRVYKWNWDKKNRIGQRMVEPTKKFD